MELSEFHQQFIEIEVDGEKVPVVESLYKEDPDTVIAKVREVRNLAKEEARGHVE